LAVRSASTSATASWNAAARSARPALRQRRGLDDLAHRRLEAGEGEVATGPPEHRPRQAKGARIAVARQALDRRTAGVGEAEQLRGLVEGLAYRIVDRRAEPPVAPDAFDHQQLAMPARDQQQQVGKIDPVAQPRRQGMAFEVVDRDEFLAARERDRLAGGGADQEAADQPRPAVAATASIASRSMPASASAWVSSGSR
jgi:hypothetical protein